MTYTEDMHKRNVTKIAIEMIEIKEKLRIANELKILEIGSSCGVYSKDHVERMLRALKSSNDVR